MGKVKLYPPVKLIAAITVSKVDLWQAVQKDLEACHSLIDCQLDWYDFHHTDYYREEMGESLRKRMVSFEALIRAETLPTIKLETNQLEDRYAIDGKRRINIDPGYLSLSKLVLATSKDFSHRIYLAEGIFADLHLKYQQHRFRPQEWSYPDYREEKVLRFFEEVRKIYALQLAEAQF